MARRALPSVLLAVFTGACFPTYPPILSFPAPTAAQTVTTVLVTPPTVPMPTTTLPGTPPTTLVPDADFWYRLAGCESGNGRASANQFQFVLGTYHSAGGTGYPGDATYEEQRRVAMRWSTMVDPGSTAGWPHCWAVALEG